MSTRIFTKICIGESTDRRTNKWVLTCGKCGKSFEPRTTMHAKQNVTCPKCGAEETVDYNAK